MRLARSRYDAREWEAIQFLFSQRGVEITFEILSDYNIACPRVAAQDRQRRAATVAAAAAGGSSGSARTESPGSLLRGAPLSSRSAGRLGAPAYSWVRGEQLPVAANLQRDARRGRAAAQAGMATRTQTPRGSPQSQQPHSARGALRPGSASARRGQMGWAAPGGQH